MVRDQRDLVRHDLRLVDPPVQWFTPIHKVFAPLNKSRCSIGSSMQIGPEEIGAYSSRCPQERTRVLLAQSQKFPSGRAELLVAEPAAGKPIAERSRATGRKNPTTAQPWSHELSLDPAASVEPAEHAYEYISRSAQPLYMLDPARLGHWR